ncbi:hypothetical protein MLD38_004853 [Melastoma candidum]|uniref:Uncharacterized protein n=1 Tax=Melastoma candidum TaxID=119954 RepID=A0ACB9S754_9MYRT|nr:hypothetical protein MLD38_004853 [Melastoma candidum]
MSTTTPRKEGPEAEGDSGPGKRGSLYVGDLSPEVTESDLLATFGEMGRVASVRVCSDALTGKSRCYAYVNFFSPSHASKALACLNHASLKDKPMRIMWSQRNPATRKAGTANLFVKNLHPSINSSCLHSIFGEFGTILSCKVAEENGRSKGFGFVQFDSEESALKALNALHDTTLEGKKIYVSKFVKKSERHLDCEEPKFTNLYVKNLEEDVTEDLLQEKFSAYGKVSNVVIMKDTWGKSRGFGFVNFEITEDAKKAVEALNGTQMGTKKLFVGRAQKRFERDELLKNSHGTAILSDFQKHDCNLYVRNLDFSIDEKKLQEYFCSCGKVTSVKVMRGNNGYSKGYGFVCFSSPAEAQRALSTLNGTTFKGKSLYVALARQKEDQHQKLQDHQLHPGSRPFLPFYLNARYSPNRYNFPLISFQHPLVSQPVPFTYQYVHPRPNILMTEDSMPSSSSTHFSGRFMKKLEGNKEKTSRQSLASLERHPHGRRGGLKPGYGKNVNRSWVAPASPAASTQVKTGGNLEELFYPLLKKIEPDSRPRVTQMLLEINESDLQKMLQVQNSLPDQASSDEKVLKEANSTSNVEAGTGW